MNIKDFSYIVAVVDCGSYSRAAEALFLSQPSLSAYIRNLERQLGFSFFENDKRTMTPEGELYVSYARKVIALDQELMQDLAQMQRMKENRMRLGITPGRSEQYLDALYDRFQKPDCNYSLDMSVDTSQHLIEKVLTNEMDVILINQPQETGGLISQSIFADKMILAMHKSNPAAKSAYCVAGDKYRHLPIDALKTCHFIIFPKGRSVRTAFDRLCAENMLTPSIVQESPSVRSACKLVSRNHGVAFVFDIPSELENLGDHCECFYVDSDCLNIDYLLAYSAALPMTRDRRKVLQIIKDTVMCTHQQYLWADSEKSGQPAGQRG